KESNWISPLIVVIDSEGPYILEGGHRYVALRELGFQSFPAVIVIDTEDEYKMTNKTAGAEDMLGGMIKNEFSNYPENPEDLTEEQRKKVKKMSSSVYSSTETRTFLFSKYPKIAYYSLWDLAKYISYLNVPSQTVRMLWDLIKQKKCAWHLPTLKDGLPEYIYKEISENPFIIKEIHSELSNIFNSPESYPSILFNSLKEKFPEEYRKCTNINEKEKKDMIKKTIQFPSNNNLEDLQMIKQSENKGRKYDDDGQPIFYKTSEFSFNIFRASLDHGQKYNSLLEKVREAEEYNRPYFPIDGESLFNEISEAIAANSEGKDYVGEETRVMIFHEQSNILGKLDFFHMRNSRCSIDLLDKIKNITGENPESKYWIQDMGENPAMQEQDSFDKKIRKMIEEDPDKFGYLDNIGTEEREKQYGHLKPKFNEDHTYLINEDGDSFDIGKTEELFNNSYSNYDNYNKKIMFSSQLNPIERKGELKKWFYDEYEKAENKEYFFIDLSKNLVFQEMMDLAGQFYASVYINGYSVLKEEDYKEGSPIYNVALDAESNLMSEIMSLIPKNILDTYFNNKSTWFTFCSGLFSCETVIGNVEKWLNDASKVANGLNCRGMTDDLKKQIINNIEIKKQKYDKEIKERLPEFLSDEQYVKEYKLSDFQELYEYSRSFLENFLDKNKKKYYNHKIEDYVTEYDFGIDYLNELRIFLIDAVAFNNYFGEAGRIYDSGPDSAGGFFSPAYNFTSSPSIIVYRKSLGKDNDVNMIVEEILGMKQSEDSDFTYSQEGTLWHEIAHALAKHIMPENSNESIESGSEWLTSPSEILAINYGNVAFTKNKLKAFFQSKMPMDKKLNAGLLSQIRSDIIETFSIEFYGMSKEEANDSMEEFMHDIEIEVLENSEGMTHDDQVNLMVSIFSDFFTGKEMRGIVESKIDQMMSNIGKKKTEYTFPQEPVPPEPEIENKGPYELDDFMKEISKREDYQGFISQARELVEYNKQGDKDTFFNIFRPYVTNTGFFINPRDMGELIKFLFNPPWNIDSVNENSKNTTFGYLIPDSLYEYMREIVKKEKEVAQTWKYQEPKTFVTPDEAEEAGQFISQMHEEYGPDFVFLQKKKKSWYKTAQIWSDETAEGFSERYDAQGEGVLSAYVNRGENVRFKNPVIPKHRLKKIWSDFAFMGNVPEYHRKALEDIKEKILNAIARLYFLTEIQGHSQENPINTVENFQYNDRITPEEINEGFEDFFTDEKGQWLLSDYGLPPLMDLYPKIYKENNLENLLFLINQVLNVV
ncbi:MAG TPA: hypothetical protein VMZ91_02210, partial [Candidatus Paceibacterota bacterium]|nr:hypothetical protein [Candidatus Paceibacterota bacterium]